MHIPIARPLGAVAVLTLGSLGWVSFLKAATPRKLPVEVAVQEAVSAHPEIARKARGRLRAMGPDGLEAITSFRLGELRTLLRKESEGTDRSEEDVRLQGALDAVARQRDAHRSRLFWFTDLIEAKAYAAKTGRPILSLRLLGNLDDELSCANSRFFRTTLYPDARVSEALRGEWVLHWESVRPAPRITIDFGDGRAIERTITGNSLHHVLAADGTPVDVLPGVYGPGAFLSELKRAGDVARRVGQLDSARRGEALWRYHQSRVSSDPVVWTVSDATVDENSRALMRTKMRGIYEGDALERTIASYERSVAEDTVRNEKYRREISSWFVAAEGMLDLASLTERIYDEIFLTPRRDPWLGLVPNETYSALTGDGRRRDGTVTGTRRAVDGTPLPSEADIENGPPPPAGEAGLRGGVKALLEMPVVRQLEVRSGS